MESPAQDVLAKGLAKAALADSQAQAKQAVATLNVYFHRSVGIGEHPQVTDEIRNLLNTLAEADDRTAALQRNFAALLS